MPLGAGAPCCVKRFLCVPSLEDWLHYERTLPPHSRCFYEVLRERTPVRYWLDLDLPASGALLAQLGVASAHACRDRLAELLQRAALGAVCDVMQAAPAELRARCVDGNGAGREACERISLHLLVDGALLPDNEHAAAAVRLAVIDRIRVAARDGDAAAAALVRCAHIESAIDRVNTKNRLRRLTGHTKLGQARWSHPMQCEEGTPASAFFVSGAAAGAGVHVLQWRVAAVCSAPIAALRERKAAAEPADVSADVGATITAELSAIALVRCSWQALCTVCDASHCGPRAPSMRAAGPALAASAMRAAGPALTASPPPFTAGARDDGGARVAALGAVPLLDGVHDVPHLPMARARHARRGARAGADAPLRAHVRHLLP